MSESRALCVCSLSISSTANTISSDQVTLSSKLLSTPSRTYLRTLVGMVHCHPLASLLLASYPGHFPTLTMVWVRGYPPSCCSLSLSTCMVVPEIDRKRQSTEPFMATYLNTFLSNLLIIPVGATYPEWLHCTTIAVWAASLGPHFNSLWSALVKSLAIQ